MQFAFTLLEAKKAHLIDNVFDKVPKKLNFFESESVPDQYSKLHERLIMC